MTWRDESENGSLFYSFCSVVNCLSMDFEESLVKYLSTASRVED